MSPQLAWLGLGNMGRGMSKNLIEKGNLEKPLVLYNRTQKRADDFAARYDHSKVKVVASIGEAVQSADIIFMCLGDDASVSETITTILGENVRGKLIVDASTIHPDTTNGLEKRITEAGGQFVGMPVFGAPAMADAGTLVVVASGVASSVSKVKPYTKGIIGRALIDYSSQPAGNATLLKVIGNTFILNMVEALSEGHVLAEKSGLGVDNLHSFIEAMFPGPYTAYSKRMLDGDYYKREEPLFHVDLARKDARHAMNLAERSGTRLPALKVADAHLSMVKEYLGEKGDIPSVYGAVRTEAGLEFENRTQ